jgi:signal transduction histidine kinase
VSALIGPLSLFAANVLSLHALPDVMRTWWLGDACGALVVVPFALAWFGGPRPHLRRSRLPEAVVVLTTIAFVSWLSMRGTSPLAYVVFPALILVAIRFGSRGATLGIVVTAAFAIWATRHYHGPFAYHSITRAVLETQLFVAVVSISTLLLAALVGERETRGEQLDIALGDAVRAGYVERHRLERNLHDGTQQRLLALLLDLSHARELSMSREVRGLLLDAEHEVDVVMQELREIARGMSPPILVERGLAGAMEDLALRSPLRVVTVRVPDLRTDVASEAAAYYVLAEAVANTQKHARATTIWLAASSTRDEVRVVAVDDGVGNAREVPGSGLAGLRERVESLGGRFDVVGLPADGSVSELLDGVASPLHGTAVTASIPFGGSTSRRI